jgi:hypothetical protein
MNRTFGALEQPRTQIAFKALDLLRQGGLCDAEPLGRTAKVQFFCKHLEITELTELH